MNNTLDVVQKHDKFVVTKNGQPFVPSRTDGQAVTTEFSNREDAEKYMNILKVLSKSKK